jgi:hypothetical protein
MRGRAGTTGGRLGGLLSLIQFAKLATLIAVAWTMLFVVALVSWQVKTWAAEGSWPTVRLSTVIEQLRVSEGATYFPASVDSVVKTEPQSVMTLLVEAPAIVPLLVALALFIAFYLWLGHAARSYGGIQ